MRPRQNPPLPLRSPLLLYLCLLALTFAPAALAQATAPEHPEWTTPIAPFRIADNLYYVGSRDLASYLVVTPLGDILINSNLTSSPPLIRASIEQLGFHIQDVKILLISHAHFDHAAGSAEIVRLTAAKYMVMDGDVPVVESGGRDDFAYPDDRYMPVRVDRVLRDGDEVHLGGTVLVAHKTPGHTRGCTTWTMRTMSGGKLRDVVIVGSWNVNSSYRLVARPGHPASTPASRRTPGAPSPPSRACPATSSWAHTAATSTCSPSSTAARPARATPSGSTPRGTRPPWPNASKPS